ncbi:MAG: TetR/AcrR family transcriptional regulator [Ilumatobacteraceae bacterium]|nr:TetR/AcrR family transcriptional regulator [Acidimicrobiales bacterium]MCB9395872.1 TetR/AcrR family transcriptional regulator [Acidimicrobiaceae bacterium]
MGYRHSRDEIVAATAATALESGVGALTFRRVAERLGISDRMVVYYLPSKADLILAAATALTESLQGLLTDAFGDERRSAEQLARVAWPTLTTPEADRVFAVYLEVIGLASAGAIPYDRLAPALLGGWLDWLADRVDAPDADERRRVALGVIAQIDGLLLVRQVLGADAAHAAATALGVA